jgi:hypothetical protein
MHLISCISQLQGFELKLREPAMLTVAMLGPAANGTYDVLQIAGAPIARGASIARVLR